ncbi:MAG: hypothetical protein ACHQAV_07280 [Solirubrobacterales bacterium]
MPTTAHTPRNPAREPAPTQRPLPASRRLPHPAHGLALLVAIGSLAAAAAGCGARSRSAEGSPQSQRTGLLSYLRELEPIRLAVNRLLKGADPTLSDYARRRLPATAASRRMEALEERFATYAVEIAAIEPTTSRLRALHAIYAHTYILEDSYLSALAVGLAERELANLPNTQSDQRAAIIQWRTGLAVLARRLRIVLPADLQVAGRGEIAPSPHGS